MINCNLHNYHQWLGAYIDGQLSPEDVLAVESFLQQHPDIMDQYLLELEDIKLEKETQIPVSFSHLMVNIIPTQNIHEKNYTQYFIQYHEKELAVTDQLETEQFVQLNPFLQKEFKLYGSVYLTADNSILYPNKTSLYKKSRPAIPLFGSIAAAASIALLITIYIFWPATHNPNAVALKSSNNITMPSKSMEKKDVNTSFTNNHIVVHQHHEKLIKKNKPHQSIEQKENIHHMEVALVDMNLNSPLVLPIISPSAEDIQPQTALSDIQLHVDNTVAENKTRKKGFFEKLLSGEKIYVEDYVNATFTAFNEKPEGSDWVLKVERDESGKSKRIKFSSPIFSTKSKN